MHMHTHANNVIERFSKACLIMLNLVYIYLIFLLIPVINSDKRAQGHSESTQLQYHVLH